MHEADGVEYPLPQKNTDRPETMTLERHNGFLKEPVEGVYYIDQLHKVGLSGVHGGIMVVNNILTGDIRIHWDELYFISLEEEEEDSKKIRSPLKTWTEECVDVKTTFRNITNDQKTAPTCFRNDERRVDGWMFTAITATRYKTDDRSGDLNVFDNMANTFDNMVLNLQKIKECIRNICDDYTLYMSKNGDMYAYNPKENDGEFKKIASSDVYIAKNLGLLGHNPNKYQRLDFFLQTRINKR